MMAEQTAVQGHPQETSARGNTNILSPDVSMLILTWVTFFSLFAILYKFAWKPILTALDNRENMIRKSVDDARKIQEQLNQMNEKREAMLKDAQAAAKEIIAQSRQGALNAAKIIEEKSKEQTHIMLENAKREIKEEAEKAQARLREESANIAVGLASKLIEKNLDEERNKKLIDDFIKHI